MRSFLLLLLLAIVPAQISAQTSWKGTVSTNWNNASNWTAGIPTSSVDVIIGDANFTGSFQPNMTTGSTVYCRALTLGTGAAVCTLSIGRNINCYGDVTIGSNGTILQNTSSRIITVKGNWTNNGNYSATGNNTSVTFSGPTPQVITGTTNFRAIAINAGTTVTLGANITANTSISISGTLDPTAGYVVSGTANLYVNTGGTLLVKAATFAGNYALTGTVSLSGRSTVHYASSAINQDISAAYTYGYLRISGGTTKYLTANLPDLNSSSSLHGRIYVDAGTFDLQSFTANRGTGVSGGYFSVAIGATVKIGGTREFPLNYSSVVIASNSTVNYYGTNQVIRDYDYGHLVFESSSGNAVKTMPATTLVIAGNFTSSAGAGTGVTFTAASSMIVNLHVALDASTVFNAGSYTHTFKANWLNNGVFTGGTSTVSFSGNGATLTGAGTNNFYHLTFTGSNMTASGSTSIAVAGNLSTAGSGLFTHGTNGTVAMTGASKTISGSGLRLYNLNIPGTITTTSLFTVAGDLTVGGTLTGSSPSVITMNGAGKNIFINGSISFYSLKISGSISTSANFTMLSNMNIVFGGSLTATAGTCTFSGASTLSGTANLFNVTINVGKSLTLGTNAVLGIAGTFTNSGSFNATSYVPNTVTYNSAGAQTIVNTTYSNLVLANGGTKTPAGSFSIYRDITIDAGVSFNASSFTVSVYRHFTNNGTFLAGTSTIQLLGSNVAIITGSTVFNNLTENKSSSTISVDLASNITTNNLTLTAGNMQTGTNTVTITGTRSGSGIIIGTITHTHAFAHGVAYYFEGPNNAITFTNPSGLTSVTVKVTLGPVANMDPLIESVNREYEITIPAGTYTNATLRYHYEDNELNAFAEPFLAIYKYNSGVVWDSVGYTTRSTTSNYVERTGITTLPGRYTGSGLRNVVRWNGSVSSAWETAANWTTISGSNMGNRIPSPTDVAQIGQTAFTNQPVLNSTQQIGLIELGSAQAVTLAINSGTLDNLGGIRGIWNSPASHTIQVGSGSLVVGTFMNLSDGTAGHDITLSIGTGSVTVNYNLTQTATGAVNFTGNGTLTLSGHYTYTAGAFNAGTGTVIYTGSESQNVAPVSYNGLSFTKTTASASINSPISVAGNLVTTTGGEIFANAAVSVNGNITIGTGTNFTENDVTINSGGNWTCNGLFTVHDGTLNFNGSGSQTVTATTFNNVLVNKSAGSVVLGGDLVINSDLTVTSGTLDLGIYQASRSNTGGMLTLASGTTLKVGGANNFPQNYSTGNLDPASTVEYVGTVAQTVYDATYGNIVFSNGGSSAKSLVANTDVAGNMTINAGSTFNPGSSATILNGNFIINGTYTPGTSTLQLNGTSKTVTGNSTLCNLVVTGSYVVSSGTTSMSGDLFVQTGGSLSFGSNAAILDGDLTVSGSLTSNGTATFTGTRVQTLQLLNAIISASTGVINFNGTVAPVLNSNTSPTFATVNINNTAGISPSVPWTVYFACNIAAGASFHGGALTHTFYGNFTNNGTVTSAGELRFVPTTPFSAAATIQLDGTSFVSTGKVTFGGTSPITIVNTDPTLNIVSVTSTAAAGVTAPSGWTIDDELQIGNGATFHAGSGVTHTIMRSITNNGTLDGQTSTIVFADTNAVINGLGTSNFYNLTVAYTSDLVTNMNISISKNLVVDGVFNATGRNVRFNGNTSSTISGTAGSLALDHLEQDKTASTTTLSIPVLVNNELVLTNGIILTSTSNLLTLDDDAVSTSGTSTSYVDGPMRKIGNDAFVFPLGDGAFWARLAISAPASTTDAFTSQYFAAAYSNTTAMAASPTPVLSNVSSIEYWTCDRTSGSSAVNVTLYWESAGRSVINFPPDLMVARWNGSAWENAGQSAVNGSDPGDVTSNSVSSFSPFTFGSLNNSNPLPIELVSFGAALNPENVVDLAWSTAVEISNDYFTVEKTTDGINYETVMIIDGAGNSSQPLNYSCVDRSPYSGVSYYRLKQTDMNGNSTYSEIETIEYTPASDFSFDLYPNPGDGSSIQMMYNATADEQVKIVIYDAAGKECHAEQFAAGNDGVNYYRIVFPATLSPGVYLVMVSSNDPASVPASRKIIVE